MDKKENIPAPEENMPDILKVMQALGGGVGIIAILTGISFIFSVVYNVIYFYVLSVPINNIPLSTSDYVSTFSAWYNVASYIIFYIIAFCFGVISVKKGYNGIFQNEKYFGVIVLIILTIRLFVLYNVGVNIYRVVDFLCFSFTMCSVFLSVNNINFKMILVLIIIFVLSMVQSVFKDIDNAILDMNEIILHKKDGNRYFIFRNFESGYLFFDECQKNILFLGKNEVQLVFDFPSYLKRNTVKIVKDVK